MGVASGPLTLTARIERWPYASAFRISGYEFTEAELLYVEVERDGLRGRGEAAGVYYTDDLPERCLADVESVRDGLERGADRSDLANLLPAGGARNALDCALWDLQAKQQRAPVWQLAGLDAPRPVRTTYTIGADAPGVMAEGARAFADAGSLKLKLTGDDEDAERVRAVRAARPDVWLGVDANQGFTRASLERIIPVLVQNDVSLIEQPLPVGNEADLEALRCPIPVAADESVQTASDLAKLLKRFQVVNIKLDKCGGLTAALEMAAAARRLGLGVMVGNMVGTSLAMAPAFVLGQLCDITDLDGPLLLQRDREPSAVYSGGRIWCGEDVWGGAR